MTHLLLTNDFPPKVGGIQSYLWELWRRLPPGRATVLTRDHPGADAFDAAGDLSVVRVPSPALLPTPGLLRQARARADEVAAALVVIDPALPLGLLGPHLGRPYAVVIHGAEVTVPARLPASRQALARVLRRARHVIAAGAYAEAEARRITGGASPPTTVIPPGVDVARFRPLRPEARAKARADLGLPPEGPLVVTVSRLVPRKGMDVLIEAGARLRERHAGLTIAVAGDGRDRRRLERLVLRSRSPVQLMGVVPEANLPSLYGCADVFAMPCRKRWAGLDQEGFGIVFLEAAASGVPQVAGASGGAAEAVVDGETGVVVANPRRVEDVVDAVSSLLTDSGRRVRMGAAARRRAESRFSYDVLAGDLARVLDELGG